MHQGVTKREGPSFPHIGWSNPWCEPNLSWSIQPHSDLRNPNKHQTGTADPFSKTLERSVSSPPYTIRKLKHTDSSDKTFLAFNYRNKYMPRAQAPLEVLPKTSDLFSLHWHSLPSPQDLYIKTTTPSTRRSGKENR
jgi:hypothetical protein